VVGNGLKGKGMVKGMKRDVCCLWVEEGGMGMINIDSLNNSIFAGNIIKSDQEIKFQECPFFLVFVILNGYPFLNMPWSSVYCYYIFFCIDIFFAYLKPKFGTRNCMRSYFLGFIFSKGIFLGAFENLYRKCLWVSPLSGGWQ
jgi:hypothetical protein